MHGRWTIDTNFITKQMLKYEMAEKILFKAFVDLKNTFDHVPREVT